MRSIVQAFARALHDLIVPAALAGAASLPACGLVESTQNIKDAATQAQVGLTNLSKIDPFATNDIFNQFLGELAKNADLATTIDKLSARLRAAVPEGKTIYRIATESNFDNTRAQVSFDNGAASIDTYSMHSLKPTALISLETLKALGPGVHTLNVRIYGNGGEHMTHVWLEHKLFVSSPADWNAVGWVPETYRFEGIGPSASDPASYNVPFTVDPSGVIVAHYPAAPH